VFTLIGLAALALLVGLFYGLGSDPRRKRLLRPPPTPQLPSAQQLPGGDPGRAIVVDSPVVIERHAERWPCPVCGSAVRCLSHRAEQLAGRRLRIAEVHCGRCGFARDVYFALRD
jgi:ribosomal protein S27AE